MVRRKTAEASLVGKTSLRVRFSEVDSMQIVWHGEYVRYFEDGREAFGREFAGLGYMDIHASGYTAPIVELQLQYKKPLRVNDTAVVETRYIATDAPLFGEGLGLDSIDALEITLLLEKHYGIRLANPAEAKPIFHSVATLADYIRKNRK